MTNEFLLMDRLQKIRQVVGKYGEDNFSLSFSGGKDSTVLSALIDMALPGNKIPRVYANTGIEYKMILDFVEREREREHSWDLVVIKPQMSITKTLEKEGYPFKSKMHSRMLYRYQKRGVSKDIEFYLEDGIKWRGDRCPKRLKYQFTEDFKIKISDKCCEKMKEEPLKKWQIENNKPYTIIGIMPDEGGRRVSAKCMAWQGKNRFHFQPLVVVTKEWENWFIDKYKIDICEIYRPPFNFERTGCKGCPFNIHVQQELDTLKMHPEFKNDYKQCEIIWKPIYEEYRRIGYRLRSKDEEGYQRTIFDY